MNWSASDLTSTITDILGRPFADGEEGPWAFDCLGMLRWVFQEAVDVELPKNRTDLYRQFQAVDEPAKPYDVWYLAHQMDRADVHVGIAEGSNRLTITNSQAGVHRVELMELHHYTRQLFRHRSQCVPS